MTNYEIRLLKKPGVTTALLHLSADTDAAAMLALKKISGMDYLSVEVWRELECIYTGDKPYYTQTRR